MIRLLIFSCLLMTTACASVSSRNAYTKDETYQMRSELKADFLIKGQENLTQEQINTLLSKKVNLQKPLKIAVAKLNHYVDQTYMTGHTQRKSFSLTATSSSSKSFSKIMNEANRVKDISVIPRFMMPKTPDIRSLRDVAAIMQADLIMVIYTKTNSDYDVELVGRNQAKAIATLETIIVDVKTGVVPFTSVATGTVHFKKAKKDFSNEEFRNRTILAAEDKAIEQLSNDVIAYFN